MKAEEKAKELIIKFMEYPNLMDYSEDLRAKKCALICVDEIIEVMPLEPHITKTLDYNIAYSEALIFWQQVKEEINKL